MIREIHIGPKSPLLTGLLDNAEDVHQRCDDQRDPAEDAAVGAVVEGRVYGEHRCIGEDLLATT